jgi:uncharacterized protein (DUF1810 family)
MADPYNLQRFVHAQDPIFEEVCSELKNGVKIGHWMWFIFPQIRGLGKSAMSIEFAISSLEEARAYLEHAVLGPRLIACTRLILLTEGRSITEILGRPDDMKFRSSMTLFARAATDNKLFETALQKHFEGKPDKLTVDRLQKK